MMVGSNGRAGDQLGSAQVASPMSAIGVIADIGISPRRVRWTFVMLLIHLAWRKPKVACEAYAASN